MLVLLAGAATAPAHAAHSADTGRDWNISLSELLRTIQLFNLGDFGCAPESAEGDGFEAGAGNRACPRHSGDYELPYWHFGLGELLRIIQFFNAGAYGVDCAQQDGFSLASQQTEGECPRGSEGEGSPEGEGAVEGEPHAEGAQDGEGQLEGATEGDGEPEGEGEGESPVYDSCAPPCNAVCEGAPPTTNGEGILVSIYNAAAVFPALDLDADTTDIDENGLIDRAHIRMLDSVLKNPEHPAYCCVVNTLRFNATVAQGYVTQLQAVPVAQLVLTLIGTANIRNGVAGLATIGERDALLAVIERLRELDDTIPVPDLDLYDLSQAPYLASWGDLDRDGVCNLAEYEATVFTGIEDFDAFVAAANDPATRPDASACPPCPNAPEGEGEGTNEGEGQSEGEGTGEGEGEGEGAVDGEGEPAEFPGCPALCEPDYAQGCDPNQEPIVPQHFAGENRTDVTFIAFGDAETGFIGVDTLSSRANIAAMNAVEGKLDWSHFQIDEPVDNVRGVIMAGDITRDGRDGRYNTENSLGEFMGLYGLCGTRELAFPIYEGYGNHDYFVFDHIGYRIPEDHPVADAVALRNPYRPGLTDTAPDLDGHYSWDWDNIHFVQVNLAPTDTAIASDVPGNRDPRGALSFLKNDLETHVKGTSKRVVVISHYGFYASWDFASWWTEAEALEYAEAIAEYDVIAHIHGHAHQTGIYTWNGLDAFNVGSPYHNVPSWNPDGRGHFAIFRITDDYLYAADASWNALDPENDIQFPDNWAIAISLTPMQGEGEGEGAGENP
jgi:cytolysin (calcineurin-like family phosphatase)